MNVRSLFVITILLGGYLIISPPKANAHCDTMNGPVVTAGQKALSEGNINFALIWVKKEDEQKLVDAFKIAQKNRLSDIKNSDHAFFESLVKIHREGEGAEYTGLKAAGDIEPSIAEADKAIATGNIHPVLELIPEKHHTHVTELFTHLQNLSKYDVNDVDAGRKYVEGYVEYVHTVEAAAAGNEIGDHHGSSNIITKQANISHENDQTSEKSTIVGGLAALVGAIGAGIGILIKKFT